MVLVFDTETTGKAKRYKEPASASDNYPRPLQLGYQVYDNNEKLVFEGNNLIQLDDAVIEEEAMGVHGITPKMCADGMGMDELVRLFCGLIWLVDVTVCHNSNFDMRVMQSQLLRSGKTYDIYQKPNICTMASTVEFCKLPNKWGNGYKWASLAELYDILFKEEFEGAHDALADVTATARCWSELKKLKVI